MLKWLFSAEYEDGSRVDQTQDDKSVTGSGSAFSDVVAKEKESKLTVFHLFNVDGVQHVYVDLRNGAFFINGTPFHAHDQFVNPKDLRLIYFREVVQATDLIATREEDESVTMSKEDRGGVVSRYFIGWQFNDEDGKNIKQTIAVG